MTLLKPKTFLLKNIPKDELFFLDFFLRYLFLEEGFAYVLFGTKPMGISGYFDLENSKSIFVSQSILPWNVKIKKGAEIFRKYQHLFLFRNCEMLFSAQDGGTDIIFINKKNFLKTFRKNQLDFRKILGSNISGQILLDQIIKQNGILTDYLKKNEQLLGILLGYGNHNAWMYERREEIKRSIHHFTLSIVKLTPSKGFATIEEELQMLNSKLQPFFEKNHSMISFFEQPIFMVDNETLETKKLKKKYNKQHKRIEQIYGKDGDFLKTTLHAQYR